MGRENLLFRESELQGKMKRLLFFQKTEASAFGGFRDDHGPAGVGQVQAVYC